MSFSNAELQKQIKSADPQKYKDVYNILWKIFSNRPLMKQSLMVHILIVNLPCHGFGDIIFGFKLANYLRDFLNVHVTIATTRPQNLESLGEDPMHILNMKGTKSKEAECRLLQGLQLVPYKKNEPLKKYDLLFLAPLSFDFTPNMSDVKKMFPYATKFNTWFFSEYNDSTRKQFDFHTGIGNNRLGLLFTNPVMKKKPPRTEFLGKYALVYLNPDIPNVFSCFTMFVEMVSHKYRSLSTLTFLVPEWIITKEMNLPSKKNKLLDKIHKNFGKIIVKSKNTTDEFMLSSENQNKVILDGTVYPVANEEMIQLMRHSLKDILVTGDQSITDVLSCCPDKNIFYQIAPWKEDFAKQLHKLLPNKHLKYKKTSCGTMKALKYKSNYHRFIRNNDFRKNAFSKLKGIVNWAIMHKLRDPATIEFENAVVKSRTKKTLKRRLNLE